MRRVAVSLPVACALLVALSGCTSDQDTLASAISAEVPGVTMTEAQADGDGYTFSVNVRAPRVRDRTEARRVARQVTRVAWQNAEASLTSIAVGVATPDGTVQIKVPTDAARRLWGRTDAGDRREGNTGETFQPDVPPGWDLQQLTVFTPDLRYGVIVPPGTSTTGSELRQGLDAIARRLWHDHPDRLTGMDIDAIVRSPTGTPTAPPKPRIVTVSYTAEELRAKFGPRASDLRR